MIEEQGRKKEIDFAKGLGILSVMLGHSITLMVNPLNTLILSFHMPLFFFLSGMTIKSEYAFRIFTWKKINSLGSAIIVSELLYVIAGLLVDVFWLKRISLSTFAYLKGFDNWFLISLLAASIVAFIVIKQKKGILSTIFMVLFLLLWSWCNCGAAFLKKYIEQGLLATAFILMGYILGTKVLNYIKRNIEYSAEMVILLIVTLCVFAQLNGPCAVAANIYGNNKWAFVVSSVLGILMVLVLSTVGESKFMVWCGKNTLTIFITHFGMQKILITIWQQLGIHNYMDYPYYFIMFIVLLVAEIILVMCFNMIKTRLQQRRLNKL